MDKYEIYKIVGNRIKQLRETQGVSQKELASQIWLSRPSINNIESGVHRIQLHTLLEVAKVLNVSLYTLIETQIPDF